MRLQNLNTTDSQNLERPAYKKRIINVVINFILVLILFPLF